MPPSFSRRRFLQSTAATAGLAAAGSLGRAAGRAAGNKAFSFVLLGDLHFDRPEHHDMGWVQKEKPNDIRQIENYCRITREVTPQLLATVRSAISDLNRSAGPRVAFVLQVGDLVEGLCGTEELALRHNTDAVALVRDARLGAPFLFTKGNHDITGPGAAGAFGQVFHPFLTEEARKVSVATEPLKNARFTVEYGNAQFVFFDAYEAAASLEWFEAVAAKRTAEHFFVVVHPPVVPYGARSTWHVFSSERDRSRREKFLALLGDQRALVLGGHIHKFNSLSRSAGRGRFAQFALSSVLSAPAAKPKDELNGVASYTPDQIRVEPTFSPANEAERRAVYAAERNFIHAFAYADLPGYAVVSVDGASVTATMYPGIARTPWRTVRLDQLAAAG